MPIDQNVTIKNDLTAHESNPQNAESTPDKPKYIPPYKRKEMESEALRQTTQRETKDSSRPQSRAYDQPSRTIPKRTESTTGAQPR